MTAVGYFGYKNYWPKLLSRITTKTTPGLVTNWTTYTNSDIGYSIKYPSGWHLEVNTAQDQNGITIRNYDDSKISKEETVSVFFGGGPTDKIYITLGFSDKLISKNETLIDWLKTNEAYTSDMSGDPISVKEVTVAGNPALVLNYSGTGNSYSFRAVNRVFYAHYGPSGTNQSKVFDQVLSTFKFTK